MNELKDHEFNLIRDFIKKNFGINLSDEKKSFIYSRLRKVLADGGFETFEAYYKQLINDQSGEMVVHFIDKVTTNHTFFMRESDHFDYFSDTVIPYIEETYVAKKDVRVWCAASSSGEEPYTLQMILYDHFKNKREWNTDLLATDISASILKKAVSGNYPAQSLEALPPEWKKHYFIKNADNTFTVADEIKKRVIYRKFNLMTEQFPFKKPFQAIFCRNVMIYFDMETRENLVNKLYNLTESGGYLFIGHSESLSQLDTRFKYIKPAIYRKP